MEIPTRQSMLASYSLPWSIMTAAPVPVRGRKAVTSAATSYECSPLPGDIAPPDPACPDAKARRPAAAGYAPPSPMSPAWRRAGDGPGAGIHIPAVDTTHLRPAAHKAGTASLPQHRPRQCPRGKAIQGLASIWRHVCGKKGLFLLSSPTVVLGPWPGNSVTESGSTRRCLATPSS